MHIQRILTLAMLQNIMPYIHTIVFSVRMRFIHIRIQLFQVRLSPSKVEKSNTSAKSLLGVTIRNTQTEQNLVSRDTIRDLYA